MQSIVAHAKNYVDPFYWSLASVQIALFLLYLFLVDFPNQPNVGALPNEYPLFQDIHIMIFIGFGFLLSFMRRFSYSGVAYSFLFAGLALQFGVLATEFFDQLWMVGKGGWNQDIFHTVKLDLSQFINGDYAAAAVVISLGAVLGKASPTQLVWMAFFEVICFSVNRTLINSSFKAVDQGGAMYIHTFGAFFGLGFARAVLRRVSTEREEQLKADRNQHGVYHSNLFAILGTIFIWCFLPSFNAAVFSSQASGGQRSRVVLNTLLALTSSVMTSFTLSKVYRDGHRFDIRDIQTASIAGGIAIASCSALLVHPWGAILLGGAGACGAMLGRLWFSNFLFERMGVHDSSSSFATHGIPGIIGGIGGAICAALWSDTVYGEDIASIFPARSPLDAQRTSGMQGAYQMAALGSSIGIGLLGGLIAGLLCSLSCCPRARIYFDEKNEWSVPEEEIPYFHAEPEANRRAVTSPSELQLTYV